MLFRAIRAAEIRASLNEGVADLLLGNDRKVIELALRAAASRLDLRRYWELRRILGTFDGADTKSIGTVLRNEFRWVAKSCLARLHLLEPLRAVRGQLRGFEKETVMRVAASPNSGSAEVVPCYGTEWRLGQGGFWVRLRRQFLLTCSRSVDLVGRPAAKNRAGSIGVVVADPTFDPGFCLTAGLEGIASHAKIEGACIALALVG